MSLKKDLIDKQARFWVLMAGGATLTRASETVGVSRATGRKWRQATGGRIPRRRPEPSGRYLSLEERLQIADLYLGGVGVRAIAVGIGRSPSTVSRELRRNGFAPRPRRLGKSCVTRTGWGSSAALELAGASRRVEALTSFARVARPETVVSAEFARPSSRAGVASGLRVCSRIAAL